MKRYQYIIMVGMVFGGMSLWTNWGYGAEMTFPPILLSAGDNAPNAPFVPYKPQGKNAWDFWFALSGDTYHAFYLEYPDEKTQPDQAQRHSRQWIGHAESKDLIHWTECPTALREEDKGIATGSVIFHEGKWFMLTSHQGFSLAESDDLRKWRWSKENPVYHGEPLEADWQGKRVKFKMLADPYLYPEKRDGYWYATVNSHIEGSPQGERGAQVLVRSKDLRHWEGWKVIAWPKLFERMETAQIWEHNGRWYLYSGVVIENAHEKRQPNVIYMASRFEGPYEAQPWLPGVDNWYIGKRVVTREGKEVFLAGQNYRSLSRPVSIEYAADGRVLFK